MTAREQNAYQPKQPTLCWECDKACGRCSWSKDFTPVEGWKAIPTKIRKRDNNYGYMDSFIVLECPEFELMREIKQGIIANAGKTREALFNKKYR